MKGRISGRLRNRRGFSLAEMLLTILVLMLVTALAASGIPVAGEVLQKTVDAANARTLLSTTVTVLRDELSIATPETCAGATVTYISGKTGARNIINGNETGQGIQIQEYLDNTEIGPWTLTGGGNAPVARPLVSDKAATANLRTCFDGISYANGVYTITNLRVLRNGSPIIDSITLEIRNIRQKSP